MPSQRAGPTDEADEAEACDGEGGEGVAAEGAEDSWGIADKLVKESEHAVADEIEMEMLTWE